MWPDVVFVVFLVSSEVCCGRPVRCGGHCVPTGACPARCVGSPSSWPPVVDLSGVVRSPVWAWSAAFGRCRPPPTPFVSRIACFVVARPVVACSRVRLLRWGPHYVSLVLSVGRCLRRLMVRLSCCWMWWPFRVGSGYSVCVGPAWHALAVRRPLIVGRALALLSLPLGGACPRGEKSFKNWYDH